MSLRTQPHLATPDHVGSYRILRLLGSGGMGDVYLAWSGLRLVAIKILHPQHANDATFVAMFLAEARVAARINHSGIAQVLDVGLDGGQLYMVMEYVAGHTLEELIRDPERPDAALPGAARLPLRIAASLFAFVAHALEAAHRAQIVHRDISPHNLLVSHTGAIKVIDFGIARTQTTDAVTSPGTFRGRFGYMAPEYVQGLPCDHRVDLFALGVVMWETFTRTRLYPGAPAAQLYAVVERPAMRLDQAIPGFPAPLANIVDRLLRRDPEFRYGSAAKVALALEELLPALPSARFRDLAHWVSHHLSERIEARALIDHDALQLIVAEEAAAAHRPADDIPTESLRALHSFRSARRGTGTSDGVERESAAGMHGFAAPEASVAAHDPRSPLRWPLMLALMLFGLSMIAAAAWLMIQARQPAASAAPAATAETPPAPTAETTPPSPAAETTPPSPTAETAGAELPAEPTLEPAATVGLPEDGAHAPASEAPREASSTSHRSSHPRRDARAPEGSASEPRRLDERAGSAASAPARSSEPAASEPVAELARPVEPAQPVEPARPVAPAGPLPPPAVHAPTVDSPVSPAAPTKTPRVPSSMAGDPARGVAIVGRCNACHRQRNARPIEGSQMTRSQWDRFFRNGSHDRYLPLGDQLGTADLAAARSYLSGRALDATADQSAGVR